jgi:hypothetical protein
MRGEEIVNKTVEEELKTGVINRIAVLHSSLPALPFHDLL